MFDQLLLVRKEVVLVQGEDLLSFLHFLYPERRFAFG